MRGGGLLRQVVGLVEVVGTTYLQFMTLYVEFLAGEQRASADGIARHEPAWLEASSAELVVLSGNLAAQLEAAQALTGSSDRGMPNERRLA